ncbi:MAG: FAD-dependent oxidoreductase [Actinobacteria bacterium]|nr:FAD-dependent oxidoreductase [Actinomycetota bacterium]
MNGAGDGRVHVVVIGAGFAGLTAATQLVAAGRSVVVLEARDRVGGRTESTVDDTGRLVDSGGQFINDDMPHVLALAASRGRTLVAGDHELASLAFRGGGEITDDPRAFAELLAAADGPAERLEGIDPAALGGRTLGDWLRSRLDGDALAAAHGGFAGAFCLSPDLLLAAHVAEMGERTPMTRDELQYVIAETLHGLAVELGAELGDGLHLGTRVRAVHRHASGSTVVAEGITIDASHVVVAVPPVAIGAIAFDPPLPDDVRSAAGAFRPGSVIKFLVSYPTAFWHDPTGSLGSVREWLTPAGLYTRDATAQADRPSIVAFLGGPSADEWGTWTPERRRTTLLEHLVEGYGPEAARPVSLLERVWAPDDLGAGGYCNLLVDPAHLDAVDVLRSGPGDDQRITFACTELAPSFPGYVEGAITAGLAAAERVLAAAASTGPAGSTTPASSPH